MGGGELMDVEGKDIKFVAEAICKIVNEWKDEALQDKSLDGRPIEVASTEVLMYEISKWLCDYRGKLRGSY